MVVQPPGYSPGITVLAIQPDTKGFQAAQYQPTVLGTQHGANGIMYKTESRGQLFILDHNQSGHDIIVSRHKLGSTIDYDISTQRYRLLQIRCHKGIVHYGESIMCPTDFAYLCNISYLKQGVGRCFQQNSPGVAFNSPLNLVKIAGVDKGCLQSESQENLIQQPEGPPIQVLRHDQVVIPLKKQQEAG
jgi:hypothetical protein